MLDRLAPQIAFAGALANSALYLWCAFLAGLASGNGAAWKFALAAMGVTYLSYFVQAPIVLEVTIDGSCARVTYAPAWLRVSVLYLSIALGVFAGVALLVR